MHKTALIITTYNRPELLKQCLDSLRNADLSKVDEIVFVDDNSDREKFKDVFHHTMEFAISTEHTLRRISNKENKGIKRSLLMAYGYVFNDIRFDYCINLDPDAIVKPNFVNELLRLKSEHPEHIISGFNCNHPQNPVTSDHTDHVKRNHCNGINMLIDKQQYETIIKPALLSSGNWDYSSTHKLPFIISKPSVIQHIGVNQSTMGHAGGDVACDFKLLSLPSVCLFGIDAHDPAGIKRAADICTRDVDFGAVKIITERLFSGREAYSKFMIKDLYSHLPEGDYTHVLTIHGDGFIQNPSAWDDEWLKLDYLGATWVYKDGKNVGNGGFSLRSKRFIEICSRLDIEEFHPEDCLLSRRYRPFLEKEFGLVWGTEEQANRFSIEAYGCGFMIDTDGVSANQYNGSFGHHGYGIKGLPHQPAARLGVSMPANRNGRVPARRR